MGKTRKNQQNRETKANPPTETFTTYFDEYGDPVTVPTDGHSNEWMRDFQTKVVSWVRAANSTSPQEKLTKEEMEYVEKHMEDSLDNPSVPSGMLTRVERGKHILPMIESGTLKVGDTLPDNVLRAYSRTQKATVEYCSSWEGSIVIYRTHGNVKHFNATQFDGVYEHEQESWIHQGNLKIEGITRYNSDDYKTSVDFRNIISDEMNTKLYTYDLDRATEVVFIDVSSE